MENKVDELKPGDRYVAILNKNTPLGLVNDRTCKCNRNYTLIFRDCTPEGEVLLGIQSKDGWIKLTDKI